MSRAQQLLTNRQDGASAAPPTPATWWLPDGITTGDVLGAYQANAASYAASKVNLANPGTNNLTSAVLDPSWSTAGWYFEGQALDTGIVLPNNQSWTMFIRATFLNLQAVVAPLAGRRRQPQMIASFDSTYNEFYSQSTATGGISTSSPFSLAIAGRECYVNTTNVATLAVATGVTNLLSCYLGDSNPPEATTAGLTVTHFALYNVTLTAPQIAHLVSNT